MDAEGAGLLFGLGRARAALFQRDQFHQTVECLSRAFAYYYDMGDMASAVAVADYPAPSYAGHRSGMEQLISRALELVPSDSHQAGRLLSRLGRLMGIEEGDYQGAQEAFSQAITIAQGENDPGLETRTLTYACGVSYRYLRFHQCIEEGLRAVDLALRTGDLRIEVQARSDAVNALIDIGDPGRARQHAAAALAAAEQLRDHFWLAYALHRNGIPAHLTGDWGLAREFYERGLALAPNEPHLIACRALLEYAVGDFEQGEHYLEGLEQAMVLSVPGPTYVYSSLAMLVPLVGRITGDDKRFDMVEEAASTVLSFTSANPIAITSARIGLALLAVQRNDIPAAEEQYAALEPWFVEGFMYADGIVATDRVLALLAQTMGQFDKAIEHFEDALAFCRRAGYQPELAWTCCDYADALLQRSQPVRSELVEPPALEVLRHAQDDRSRAMALLDESLAISRELGMRPLMERVLSRREILRA